MLDGSRGRRSFAYGTWEVIGLGFWRDVGGGKGKGNYTRNSFSLLTSLRDSSLRMQEIFRIA